MHEDASDISDDFKGLQETINQFSGDPLVESSAYQTKKHSAHEPPNPITNS